MNYYSSCFCAIFCFCFWLYLANNINSTLSVSENKYALNLEADGYLKNIDDNIADQMGEGGSRGARRLLLGGPGSSPPHCSWKCGGCMPCKAVHVPVPPRTVGVTMEYYPEAWRCKCGNKLYMP